MGGCSLNVFVFVFVIVFLFVFVFVIVFVFVFFIVFVNFFGHVMSSHHSEQMSQRSQVSRIALKRCSQNVLVFVFVFVFVSSVSCCIVSIESSVNCSSVSSFS